MHAQPVRTGDGNGANWQRIRPPCAYLACVHGPCGQWRWRKTAASLFPVCIPSMRAWPVQVMALAQNGSDLAALEESSIAMGKVADQLDELTDRWMELAELAGDL